MNLYDDLLCALDPAYYSSTKLKIKGVGGGVVPAVMDDKQSEILRSESKLMLVTCTRQWGKTTVAAILATHAAEYRSSSLIVIVSPSERQSKRVFEKVKDFIKQRELKLTEDNALSVKLANGSTVIAAPGNADTIRGYSGVDMLIFDEAAFSRGDELYYAVRPMVTVSQGDTIIMTTPKGKRGFYWSLWDDDDIDCLKISVTADECDRVTDDMIAEFRKTMPEYVIRQEFYCEFVEAEDAFFSHEHIQESIDNDLEPFF